MKETRIVMGMPVTIDIPNLESTKEIDQLFDYFISVDEQFSTYKETSEISAVNRGLPNTLWSSNLKLIIFLAEQTRIQTNGYFNIRRKGTLDPSGLVKGWTIQLSANRLLNMGIKNFYIDAGGDIQVHGLNSNSEPWKIGLRHPLNRNEIVKTVRLTDKGIATSGSYIRGQHIYDPHNPDREINDIVSLSVIGPNIYESDRYATAAFAMGREGIAYIESINDLEGYMIDSSLVATMTSGFNLYTD